MPANLENSTLASGLEKVSFHSNPTEMQCQRMFRLLQTTLISHTSKVMLKILQARLQWYMNCDLPNVQTRFRKGRGTRDQIANIRWIIEKARECQKSIYFCFIDYAKAIDCVDHNKLWKILRDWNTRPPYLPPENLYTGQEATVRTGHGTTDWFQIGKGVRQGVYCHFAYLTYMQRSSLKMPGWMKHKLESKFPGEISITSDTQMTPPIWQKVKKN